MAAMLRAAAILLVAFAAAAAAAAETGAELELIEHGWSLGENWQRIGKTQYRWRAVIANHATEPRRVTVYFMLLDRAGAVLDRSVAAAVIPAGATGVVESDSYLDTSLVPRAAAGRVDLRDQRRRP
jgi:hypothetical protein